MNNRICTAGMILFVSMMLPVSGCNNPSTNPSEERPEGQSDFTSLPWSGGNLLGGEDTYSGVPNKGSEGASQPRAIEEGDIWRLSGDYLYVLNQYRGLQIIKIADVDHPKLAATVPILGRPVEMYLRDGNAYVVVSDYLNCWMDTSAKFAREFQGSQLRIVDVRQPESPRVAGGIDLKGFVTDSRIVGEVMYLVSDRYSYYYYNSSDSEDLTSVYSVNIADPASVRLTDQAHFQRNQGYDNHVNVTENAIFIAAPTWGWMDAQGTYHSDVKTRITYVDIHDPDGAIALGTAFDLKGYVGDRWQMDFYDGVLRIIAPEQSWGNGYPTLFTFKVTDPFHITQLAAWQVPLPTAESVKATRFDGTRAYVVTYLQKDPLFVIDLTDPASPKLGGELQMPGWLDFLEPRGDLLVALGHDDSNGNNVLAVSAFDVKDMKNPRMLSRVTFGEQWGWVPGEKDDIQKVFKVIDELNLILVPFQGWSQKNYRSVSGVQLIDYDPSNVSAPLTRRGMIEHDGWVERAIPVQNRVLTFSNESFQVVDASDRDNPRLTAVLELARNSGDFVIAGGVGVELSGDANYYGWYYNAPGSTPPNLKIAAVPADDPNNPVPYSEVKVDGYSGRLFADGKTVFAVSTLYESDAYKTRVVSLDFTDPLNPKKSGVLDVPAVSWSYGYYGWWGVPGGGDGVVQLRPGVFVFMDGGYYQYGSSEGSTGGLWIVDASSPSNMKVASSLKYWFKGGGYLSQMKAVGDMVYITYSVPVQDQGRYFEKYYLGRVDLSDIGAPKALSAVNIPGVFIGASDDGRYIYTAENMQEAGCVTAGGGGTGGIRAGGCVYGGYYQAINTLALLGDKAYLRDTFDLYDPSVENESRWIGNILVQNNFAYFVLNNSSYKDNVYSQSATLNTLDLRTARDIKSADSQQLPVPNVGLRESAAGRLLLDFYGYSSGGMLMYSLNNPASPTYDGFFRTQGYPFKVKEGDGRLYLPSGYYGVQVVDLR